MATYTPVIHQVFDELDDFGLLLDLPRIEGERNPSYKQRLFDVFTNRANSSYSGLINGITRELGLSLYHAMTITPVLDNNGATVGENPAISFEETKCYIYSDWTDSSSGLVDTIDRYEKTGGAWSYEELVSVINSSDYMYAAIQSDISQYLRSMTIFNQKSIKLVTSEELSKGSIVINLDNQNLLSSSVSVSSSNMFERVDSQLEVIKDGQYFIDYDLGIVYTKEVPANGSVIRYEYRDDNFEVWASPVIIHGLSSSDFKEKMFEQILMENGTYENGAPTGLGADLINELMSIFGYSYAP
jgi:hypothetical protein